MPEFSRALGRHQSMSAADAVRLLVVVEDKRRAGARGCPCRTGMSPYANIPGRLPLGPAAVVSTSSLRGGPDRELFSSYRRWLARPQISVAAELTGSAAAIGSARVQAAGAK
jgi:hypothetical protein